MDARPLDELADDASAENMLNDHAFHSRGVDPIIQSCSPPRGWHGRESAEPGWLLSLDLSHKHVRPLRAAAEAALPDQLCALPRGVRLQRRSEHLVQGGGSAPVTAFGTATDHDSELRLQRPSA